MFELLSKTTTTQAAYLKTQEPRHYSGNDRRAWHQRTGSICRFRFASRQKSFIIDANIESGTIIHTDEHGEQWKMDKYQHNIMQHLEQ
jgi:hypothetical protein